MSEPEYHNGDDLLRTICGSLKSCIDSHGPITKEWVGSAAKRIVGLVGVKAAEVARLQAQLAELRAEHQSCLDGDEGWAEKWKHRALSAEADRDAARAERDDLKLTARAKIEEANSHIRVVETERDRARQQVEDAFKAGYHCVWSKHERRYYFYPAFMPGDPDGAWDAYQAAARLKSKGE